MATWNRLTVKVGDTLVTKNGQKTRWTIISPPYIQHHGPTYARMQCVCGTIQDVRVSAVLSGKSNGCGTCAGVDKRDWPSIGAQLGGYTVLDCTIGKKGTMIKGQCRCGRIAWKSLQAVRTAIKLGRESACKNCRPWRQLKPNPLGRQLRAVWKKAFPDVTLNQLTVLIKAKCFYCGGPPTNVFRTDRHKTPNETIYYQGIDEVVYGAGHRLGNILPCCIICNKAKNNHTLEDFCVWYNRRRPRKYHLSPECIVAAAKQLGIALQNLKEEAL